MSWIRPVILPDPPPAPVFVPLHSGKRGKAQEVAKKRKYAKQQYHVLGKTLTAIGNEMGCSRQTVWWYVNS